MRIVVLLFASILMLVSAEQKPQSQQPVAPTAKGQAMPIVVCTQAHPCGKFPALKITPQEPRAEDVSTIDGIIKAYYEVVSGPKGEPRQWARDRTLYTPELRFLSVGERRQGKLAAVIMDHQSYAESSEQLAKNGFFEREVHRVTHQFGHIAHVFSTYESRATPDGPVTARGINSIELLFDGRRWRITYAQWDEERPGQKIPKEFLP